MQSYISRLNSAVIAKKNAVVVGLDPRFSDLPEVIRSAYADRPDNDETRALAFEVFCKQIIDVVAPLVPAVKPQSAFFEECGPQGGLALASVIKYARQAGLIVICDAKRGDIGSTAEAYARAYLAGEDINAAPWGADALTISPYLGSDTLTPFIDVALARGAGLYVLVRTSNPGAGTFQDRLTDGQLLYQRVAQVVEEIADRTRGSDPFGLMGAVVGATYPQEITELRAMMPHVQFLVPGYGSQGGKAKDVAGAFVRVESNPTAPLGAVVNSSRGIIFAHKRKDYLDRFSPKNWQDAVQAATREMILDLGSVL